MADATDPYLIKIRDQYFHVEIFLYNELDDKKELALPFSFVDSFSITESLLNWNTNGWIVIKTPFEVLERGGNGSEIDTTIVNATVDDCYIFRTDGRNKISFRLYPVNESENQTYSYSEKYWEMCYDFVIYAAEDVETYSNQTKMRKYKFWDERYQILSERNIEYSTAYSALKKRNSSTSTENQDKTKKPFEMEDIYRSCNPNLALMDIIKTSASNPPVMDTTESTDKIKVGYLAKNEGGTIESPTRPMDEIDTTNWDEGHADNYIFYTSPANFNALMDMEYVLHHCKSYDGSPVFLQFGRSTHDKKWKLISLKTLLKTSNEQQVESLYIEDSVASDQPTVNRADLTTTMDEDIELTSINDIPSLLLSTDDARTNSRNFTSPVASKITSYNFSPMLSLLDENITNTIIHNYDFSTGTFNIYIENNRAKDVKTKLEEFGKEGLYNFSDKNNNRGNAHVLITLNQTKTDGMMLKNVLKPQRFFPKDAGLLKMLRDAVVYNQAINFKAHGLTLRAPGKFIAINRIGSDGKLNPFDDRFLGQWLVMEVEHVFTDKSYHNNVVAVKIDTFSKLWTDKTEEKI